MAEAPPENATVERNWKDHLLMALGADYAESDSEMLLEEIDRNKPETFPAEAESILYHRLFLNLETSTQTVWSTGLVIAAKRTADQNVKISSYSPFAALYRCELKRMANATPVVFISGRQIDREGGLTEHGLVKALCIQLIDANPEIFDFG